MKLVVAVVQDRDWPAVTSALVRHDFRVTKVSSTGGFLRRGNTTLLVGVEDSAVETVTKVIRDTCRPREELVTDLSADATAALPISVVVGGATIFVVDVERHEKV